MKQDSPVSEEGAGATDNEGGGSERRGEINRESLLRERPSNT